MSRHLCQAVAPITTTPDAAQAGRPWYENNGWNNLTPLSNGYGGLSPYELNVALKTTVNTPNGTPRHIDISSSDLYWFAGAHANVSWVMDGGAQIAMGGQFTTQQHRNITSDEAARGSNYGDQVDMMRIAQSTGFPAPVTAFVENGGPYTENSTAVTYITPPELNWAVWSSLIHGAQQIIYFNHSFGGPGFSFDNIGSSYYDVSQPGQTISIYDQMNATNALIAQMAPVLNSPYALNYVSVNGPHWSFETLSQPIGGLEVMARNYNDDFYIFADTRESRRITTSRRRSPSTIPMR